MSGDASESKLAPQGLVQSLRKWQRHPEYRNDGAALCGYAADEIERLQASKRERPPEIERLIDAAISYMRDGPAMNYMNLRAALDAVRPGWRETK